MTRKVAAIVSDAALRAMDKRNSALKANSRENRSERLAGLGRVDRQSFTGEILFAIPRGLGPFPYPFQLRILDGVLEVLPLVLEHLFVFRTAEQVEVIEYVFG